MTHLIDGEFQSDKYPTCPRGKVPLSCKDPMAQDLLWEYAQRRRAVDEEFADDLETALVNAGHHAQSRRDPRFVTALTRIDRLIEWFKDCGIEPDCEEQSNVIKDLEDIRTLLSDEK